jgi:hypothetical protein
MKTDLVEIDTTAADGGKEIYGRSRERQSRWEGLAATFATLVSRVLRHLLTIRVQVREGDTGSSP